MATSMEEERRYLLLQASYANMAKKPDTKSHATEQFQASTASSTAPKPGETQPQQSSQ